MRRDAAESRLSTSFPVRAPAWSCLLACATLGLSSGCGGDDNDTKRTAQADAELARAIEASAKRHQRETETLPPASNTQASAPSHQLFSSADRRSFSGLAAQLPGDEGVAVTTVGRPATVSQLGQLKTGIAWSTAKVPVAMAAIRAGVARSDDLVRAITASDNAAAERLWTALGEGETAAHASTAQLREAGDSRTEIQSQRLLAGYTAFGQTQWALRDQALFVAGMPCVAAGRQVRALMDQVVAGQRWGLGSTGKPAQFKAGWGPGISPGAGNGWLDRQMGIITIGGRPLAIALATTAADHTTGTTNLTAIAAWVVAHIDASHAPRSPQC